MKEEEGRRIAAVDAFNVAEKRVQELKNKLAKAKRDKKSAETTLEWAKRQVEGQWRQLRQTKDQLAASKEQIVALKKKLKEVEKARDQAKQDGYDVGVEETEKALKAEVSEVCRNYCLQVWNKVLNQARVEASFALRRAKSVYYPPVIRAFGPISSKIDTASDVVHIGKASPTKKSFLLLTALPRWSSSLGLLKRKQIQPREWPQCHETPSCSSGPP